MFQKYKKLLGIERTPLALLLTAAYAAVGALIVGFHAWSLDHVAPILDGSNCTSRVSNLALLLQHGDFRLFFSHLAEEKNNLLSVLWFSLATLVTGPGRMGFGLGWVLALATFVLANLALLRRSLKPASIHLALLLFLALTPLLSRSCGMLTQRFDALAVLVLTTALSALAARRFPTAAFLVLAAVATKGASLPVAGLCIATYFATHPGSIPELFRGMWKQRLAWLAFGALTVGYLYWALSSIVGYNLMAVKSGQSPLAQFIASLRREPSVYLTELYRYVPLAPLFFLGAGVLFLVRFRQASSRLLLAGAALVLLTIILFTSHPVHSWVLVVWFIPGFWWTALGVAAALEERPRLHAPAWAGAALLLALGLLYMNVDHGVLPPRLHYTPYASLDESMRLSQKGLQAFAGGLAQALKREALPSKQVRLLVNFLFVPHQNLHFNYDALRVLLFEELGRSAPRIEGWEFATYSPAWRAELAAFADTQEDFAVILVGSDVPEHHFRGLTGPLEREVSALLENKGRLAPLLLDRSDIPMFGPMKAYAFDHAKARELFKAKP